MTLTLFYCLSQETWLDDSWKLVYRNQSRFYNFNFTKKNSKKFNITSIYFSMFNNKPPASWVAHITRDFLTCYSCSYYSSMFTVTYSDRSITNEDQTLKLNSCNLIITKRGGVCPYIKELLVACALDTYNISVFRSLISFLQFTKSEKQRWRSVAFSKVLDRRLINVLALSFIQN